MMKRIRYSDIQQFNPVRPVDWRWQRALQLIDTPQKRSRILDDSETIMAAKFLRSLRRCQTEKAKAKLATRCPAIAAAYAIHTGKALRRIEIQASLLAGQPLEEIAKLLNCAPAALTMYESIFYNVQERLDAELYILGAAIGWKAFSNIHGGMDAEAAVKTIAYFGGPLVLNSVLPLLKGTVPEANGTAGDMPSTAGNSPDGVLSPDDASIHERAKMLFDIMRYPLSGIAALQLWLFQKLQERTLLQPHKTTAPLGLAGYSCAFADCADSLFDSASPVALSATEDPPPLPDDIGGGACQAAA